MSDGRVSYHYYDAYARKLRGEAGSPSVYHDAENSHKQGKVEPSSDNNKADGISGK